MTQFNLPEGTRERAAVTFLPPEGGIDPTQVTLGPTSWSPTTTKSSQSPSTTLADVEAAIGLEALSKGSKSPPDSATSYSSSMSNSYSTMGPPQPNYPPPSPWSSQASLPPISAATGNPYSYSSRPVNRMSATNVGSSHPYAMNPSPFPEPNTSRPMPTYSASAGFTMPPEMAANINPDAERPPMRDSRRSSFSFGSSSRGASTPGNFRFV